MLVPEMNLSIIKVPADSSYFRNSIFGKKGKNYGKE